VSVQLSVILPVFNGEPYLRYQLRSLAEQVCSFTWEVIVVDNASTDGSASVASSFVGRLPGLRVLSERRQGKSYALNTGIAAASGEYLVFVDADDEIAPGYLEAMAAGLGEYEMVAGRMDTELLNPPWARAGGHRPDALTEFLDWLVFVGGGLLGIRSATQRRVGPFATDLTSAEDVDFTWRAQLLGVTTGFVPDAVLHVRRPLSSWDVFRKGRSYGRAHVQLYLRFREHGQPRRRPRAVLRHGRDTLRALASADGHGCWLFAMEGGVLLGRFEESVRLRVIYL
jgi:glycosyltransferase involved in cell wall biosynthesis